MKSNKDFNFCLKTLAVISWRSEDDYLGNISYLIVWAIGFCHSLNVTISAMKIYITRVKFFANHSHFINCWCIVSFSCWPLGVLSALTKTLYLSAGIWLRAILNTRINSLCWSNKVCNAATISRLVPVLFWGIDNVARFVHQCFPWNKFVDIYVPFPYPALVVMIQHDDKFECWHIIVTHNIRYVEWCHLKTWIVIADVHKEMFRYAYVTWYQLWQWFGWCM